MDRQDAQSRLSAFFDGELPSEISVEMETFVDQDDELRDELRFFQSMRQALQASDMAAPSLRGWALRGWALRGWAQRGWAQHGWDRLSAKLQKLDLQSNSTTTDAAHGLRIRKPLSIASALALAATVLIMAGFWYDSQRSELKSLSSIDTIAINYGGLVTEFNGKAADILQSMSQTYEGKSVSLENSNSKLGYQPTIAKALPVGLQLVSNMVLKLPFCDCVSGQCTCGPRGCNCAASLCRRPDGSEILIVEHCHSQNVSFGDLERETIARPEGPMELLRSEDHLAVTWISNRRRLTAFGVDDPEDAKSLVTSLSSL